MTAVTDLRSLLSDINLEKLLLGSDANFQKLSTKDNFTVNKVNLLLQKVSLLLRPNNSKPVKVVQFILSFLKFQSSTF